MTDTKSDQLRHADEYTFVGSLRSTALRDLGLEDNPRYVMLIDSNGDQTRSGPDGAFLRPSRTREVHRAHQQP